MRQLQISESHEKYQRGNHFVGVSLWEFEWCPKYRYKMMKGPEKYALVGGCIRFAALVEFISFEAANEYVRNKDRHHGTVWNID